MNNWLTTTKSQGLSDPLFLATTSNVNSIPTDRIVYISCDAASYPGFTTVADVLAAAQSKNATAILFYSITANYCNITGQDSSYHFLYTMTSTNDSQTIVNRINASSNNLLNARIDFANSINNTTGANTTGSSTTGTSGTSTNQSNQSTLGPSPTTAVAMIILYSITGLITGLFLIIIITGAVRAHRHPERYGSRNIMGRPHQSRAKGLARAILDTIPIVKFGEQREEATGKDIEMGDSAQSSPATIQRSASEVAEADARAAQAAVARRNSLSSARSVIGPAAAGSAPVSQQTPAAPLRTEDAPGCSICTDDFEAGQDLRVLPCDHKFHPACIDPWLLNVSGTCPLCRIDLHGPRDENDIEGDGSDLPPPIGAEPAQRNSLRRALLVGLMGTPRVQESSADERVAAIRRLRAEQIARRELAEMGDRPADANVSDERERGRRSRFGLFGIRTRRQAEGPGAQ